MDKEELLILKEKCLPKYLLKDIENYLKYKDDKKCNFVDCLKDEIYGSINSALYSGEITKEMAEYLREKYIFNN